MLDRYDQDLLLDYLEGELDADRRAQLDAMLAEDPQLAALLNEMALDRAALRSIPEAQAPADLVHDVTSTLERRMLLDEPVDETGPIPISRGRGLNPEPARSISWGRVVGLTGLAASVALAAGIVVITLDDPLERTANELASTPRAEADEALETAAFAGDDLADQPALGEGIVGEARDAAAERAEIAEGLLADVDKPDTEGLAPGIDREALARGPEPADPLAPSRPTTAPELDLPAEPAAEPPIENFGFGLTAAISVIQPSQKLVLLTESPEVSLEQLFEFCVANGIPIVQPEEHAASGRGEDLRRDSETFALGNAAPGTAESSGEESNVSYGDYALLINESQLDTLVRDLNNDVTIDPDRAGKASLISNQAAVLAELPKEDAYLYYGQPRAARTVQPEPNDALPEAVDDPAEGAELVEQQAIQLQLPKDLGSDYANSRNAYNLQRSQQKTGYAMPEKLKEEFADTPPPTDAVEDVAAPEPAPEALAEADVVEAEQATPSGVEEPADESASPDQQAAAPSDELHKAAKANDQPTQPAAPIDPTRGNWLSAHLPSINATPLLLQWRADQSDKPTKLIPVMIQRAEPDRVNTLRKQQQVELASRKKDADAKEVADGLEASEQAELEPAVEPAAPADDVAK